MGNGDAGAGANRVTTMTKDGWSHTPHHRRSICLLLANRVRVWGCISLRRASNDSDRDEVERVLLEEASGDGKQTLDK